MKKLALNKKTIASLSGKQQNGILGGVRKFTYYPGDDCGRSEAFTYVAACPPTFVCGTGDECGGGGYCPFTLNGHPCK